MLQTVDLLKLSEKERAVVFLNIYHIMILHGNLVLGAPKSWYNWPAFFNGVSYIINLECITIAELEHCILRAASSAPSPKLSKFVVPSIRFPSLALKKRDFRINFCLNCGSGSMPSLVPIYNVKYLDEQFDEMTKVALRDSLKVDDANKVIFLPTICLWYWQDFVPPSTAGPAISLASSLEHCVNTLATYVQGETKVVLRRLLQSNLEKSVNGSCTNSADGGNDQEEEEREERDVVLEHEQQCVDQ